MAGATRASARGVTGVVVGTEFWLGISSQFGEARPEAQPETDCSEHRSKVKRHIVGEDAEPKCKQNVNRADNPCRNEREFRQRSYPALIHRRE